MIYKSLTEYSKRDLNPHSHYWPKDFKSFASTHSSILQQALYIAINQPFANLKKVHNQS